MSADVAEQETKKMEKAEKSWKRFAKKHNLRGVNVDTCCNCAHVEHGYEGEIDCEHPDRWNVDKLGRWTVTNIDYFTVCDKWEVKG
jgi:hypothetical protein